MEKFTSSHGVAVSIEPTGEGNLRVLASGGDLLGYVGPLAVHGGWYWSSRPTGAGSTDGGADVADQAAAVEALLEWHGMLGECARCGDSPAAPVTDLDGEVLCQRCTTREYERKAGVR